MVVGVVAVSIYLSIHPSIHPSIYLSTYLSIYLSISLSICLSACPVCLFVCLSTCKLEMQHFCKTSSGFERGNVKNKATLRLAQVLNVATSKFCETSSIFEVDNIKNEALLRDFLQESKVECRADGLVPMRFAIVSFHLSKVLRLPRKSEARSYEVLRLSRMIILANLKI